MFSAVSAVKIWLSEYLSSRVDRQFGLETGIGPDELTRGSSSVATASRYDPVGIWGFKRIMRAVRHSGDFEFVDIGCGKGRALFFAAKYPFRRIHGIELSDQLYEVGLKNIAIWQAKTGDRRISISKMDACIYEPPPAPLFVFLFNPFTASITRAWLENMRRSFSAAPRPLYIAWLNITPGAAPLEEASWLRCVYSFRANPEQLPNRRSIKVYEVARSR